MGRGADMLTIFVRWLKLRNILLVQSAVFL